jgi:Flp pilus assembly pilin Flp
MSLGSVVRQVRGRMKGFFRSQEGLAITEYGLLVALVALALVAVLAVFAPGISGWFASKTGQVTTV